MPRFARIVVPGYPYHVTHRGNRTEDVFLDEEDRETYRKWLKEYANKYGLEIWAYCLMTNHVHLIASPRKEGALANAIGRAHMRFARYVRNATRSKTKTSKSGEEKKKYITCPPILLFIIVFQRFYSRLQDGSK